MISPIRLAPAAQIIKSINDAINRHQGKTQLNEKLTEKLKRLEHDWKRRSDNVERKSAELSRLFH